MKACLLCDEFNGSVLHPYCEGFNAPIRVGNDWILQPVKECVEHEITKEEPKD